MAAQIEAVRDALHDHISTEPKEWAKVLSDLMSKSFPDGDPEGHRRYHEAILKEAEKKAEFWVDMSDKLKKWGLIGFALWAIKVLVEAAAIWIQNGAHIK